MRSHDCFSPSVKLMTRLNRHESPKRIQRFRFQLIAFFLLTLTSSVCVAESANNSRIHIVRKGQTLKAIAARYNVTIDNLAAENGINPENPLSVGKNLRIPKRGSGNFHVVRSGETAAQIARIEGCTTAELIKANKLRPSARLSVGQILKIPDRSSSSSQSSEQTLSGRQYRVKSGESLNEIAHRYGIGTKILMRANKIRNPRSIQPGRILIIPDPRSVSRLRGGKSVRPIKQIRRITGQKRKGAVIHRVMDGQSWRMIARSYRTTIKKLRKANPRLGSRLQVGNSVRIPGAKRLVAVPVANCGYPGIRFEKGGVSKVIRLITCKGQVHGKGRRQLTSLTSPRRKNPGRKLFHPQLIRRLQRVADEFPGRTFRIMSGYRAPRGERAASQHNHGRALDFSVQGISNKTLYNFCRQLPSTGCGFYPNSTFVHLDYRSKSAHWVDFSGPGEAPDYSRVQSQNGSGTDQ